MQTSVLASYVKVSDFFANLADYVGKETVGTEILVELGKYQLVAASNFFEIRRMFDFGTTPTDGWQRICTFTLNSAGIGNVQVSGVDVALVGASYTKTESNGLLATKANTTDLFTANTNNIASFASVATALATKADSASVYTRSEANTLLATKANSTDLATANTNNATSFANNASSFATLTTSLATKAATTSAYTKDQVDAKDLIL